MTTQPTPHGSLHSAAQRAPRPACRPSSQSVSRRLSRSASRLRRRSGRPLHSSAGRPTGSPSGHTSEPEPRDPLRLASQTSQPDPRASPKPGPQAAGQSPSFGTHQAGSGDEPGTTGCPRTGIGAKRTAAAAFGIQPARTYRETVIKWAPPPSQPAPEGPVYSQQVRPAGEARQGEVTVLPPAGTASARPENTPLRADPAGSGRTPAPGPCSELRLGHDRQNKQPAGQRSVRFSSFGVSATHSAGLKPVPEPSAPTPARETSAPMPLGEPSASSHGSGFSSVTEAALQLSDSRPSVIMHPPRPPAASPRSTFLWHLYDLPDRASSPAIRVPGPSAPTSLPERLDPESASQPSLQLPGPVPRAPVPAPERSTPSAGQTSPGRNVTPAALHPVVRPVPLHPSVTPVFLQRMVRPDPLTPVVRPLTATLPVRHVPVQTIVRIAPADRPPRAGPLNPVPTPPYILEIGRRLGLVPGGEPCGRGSPGEGGAGSGTPPCSP